MKYQKRLALRRETMTDLGTDELGGIVAAGFDLPPSAALCNFSAGDSCAGVCSGYCPSFTCPSAKPLEEALRVVTIQTS